MYELQLPDNHLLFLIQQAKQNYQFQEPKRKRGKPVTYSACSFWLLNLVAVLLRAFSASELHLLLEKDAVLRQALDFEQVPHRKTIARRISSLTEVGEQQIAAFGSRILTTFALPKQAVSAIDGRMYQALGPLWHKKDRQLEIIPPKLRNVDTESEWFKSGYRGWVQGYRLVLQGLVFPEPVPLFAVWRPNNEGESTIVKESLRAEKLPITDIMLGDETFGGKELGLLYEQQRGYLLTPKQFSKKNRTWKNDLFEYRKETIELLFQRVIQATDIKECKVKGLGKNGAFVLASVWLYQLVFWCNHQAHKPLTIIKEQVDLARWRVPF
jgi:hypothetical protein